MASLMPAGSQKTRSGRTWGEPALEGRKLPLFEAAALKTLLHTRLDKPLAGQRGPPLRRKRTAHVCGACRRTARFRVTKGAGRGALSVQMSAGWGRGAHTTCMSQRQVHETTHAPAATGVGSSISPTTHAQGPYIAHSYLVGNRWASKPALQPQRQRRCALTLLSRAVRAPSKSHPWPNLQAAYDGPPTCSTCTPS